MTPGGERYAFPILFVLSVYLLSTAAYLADECDTDRHMMGIITMMKAAAWPLIIMLCEDAVRTGAGDRKQSAERHGRYQKPPTERTK